jgi:Kef-type K+ transport system membrane component KefB
VVLIGILVVLIPFGLGFALVLSGEKPWITLILALVFSVAIVCIGRLIGRPALCWLRARLSWPSGFIAVTSIMILAAAVAAEAIGIHAIFSAFLLGVALGRSHEERNQAPDTVYQFAVSFFAPLYFVLIGLMLPYICHGFGAARTAPGATLHSGSRARLDGSATPRLAFEHLQTKGSVSAGGMLFSAGLI